MEHITININKDELSVNSILTAFIEQKVIEISMVAMDKGEKHNVFITSFEWINRGKLRIRFVTLFQAGWMIPGVYEMETNKSEFFADNSQILAYLCETGPIKE